MTSEIGQKPPQDGAVVSPGLIPAAVTAGELLYDDGATQVFSDDGTTTYVENGRPSQGTWYVEGTSFCSFWPPSFTGCYHLTWVVEDAKIVGLKFADLKSASSFVGRYQP